MRPIGSILSGCPLPWPWSSGCSSSRGGRTPLTRGSSDLLQGKARKPFLGVWSASGKIREPFLWLNTFSDAQVPCFGLTCPESHWVQNEGFRYSFWAPFIFDPKMQLLEQLGTSAPTFQLFLNKITFKVSGKKTIWRQKHARKFSSDWEFFH